MFSLWFAVSPVGLCSICEKLRISQVCLFSVSITPRRRAPDGVMSRLLLTGTPGGGEGVAWGRWAGIAQPSWGVLIGESATQGRTIAHAQEVPARHHRHPPARGRRGG